MANHGYGYLDHETSIKEIFLYADLCNVERFGGVLDVRLDSENEEVYVNHPTTGGCYFLGWLTGPKNLEYRHGNRCDLEWYLDMYFAEFIINELGGKVGDDGHEELVDPDFPKRYPTFRSWFEKKNLYKPDGTKRKFTWLYQGSMYRDELKWAGKELAKVI